MLDRVDKALRMARCELFRPLPEVALLELAGLASVEERAAGAALDEGPVYVVVRGRVRAGGRVAGPGDALGESEGPLEAEVVEPAELVRLERDDFADAVAEHPSLAARSPAAPRPSSRAAAAPEAPFRAFVLGAVTVFLTAAGAVIARAYADAVFLDVYGAGPLPQFFIVTALAFAVVTLAYDTAARRARTLLLDGGVIATFGAAAALAPLFARRGGATTFVVALVLVALASIASLAAWNVVAGTVSGRSARRLMPRAGAALTAGGVLAGFGASGFIARFGLEPLPRVAAVLSLAMLAFAFAARRAAGRRPPQIAAPSGQGAPRSLVRWLVIACVVEALLNVFVEIRFKTELRATYGGAHLGVVLSAFMGTTNSLLLLLQLFVVPRLVISRSLPVTAALHPLTVAGALAAGWALPAFAGAGLARASDSVLRAATARHGQDLALSALAEAPRQRWKVLLRGAFIPLGTAIGGGLLLVMRPSPWISFGLALLLALITRRAARAFLDVLAAPLGVRTVAAERAGLDLDALLRLIERSGSSDPDEARLSRAAILAEGHAADELSPHLLHADPAVRAALFTMAARRPAATAVGDLRAAVAVEDDDEALAAGLRALAAHEDDGAVDRARGLVRSGGGVVGRAAAAYLAQLGRLGPEDARAALRAVLAVDGEWAAAVARGAGLDGERPGTGLEALRHAVASGDLEPWLQALSGGSPPLAERALAGLALPVQALRAREIVPAMWVAVLAAARWAAPSAAGQGLMEELLAHEHAAVRAAAAAALCRAAVSADAVQRGLDVELEGLDRLLAAHAPAEEMRGALARALGIAALAGNGAAVRAAGRRLMSANEDERRRAVDVLQEVARVSPRLTALVERMSRR